METDSTLKVKLTASFNAQVTQPVYFAIGVVQDSIIDVQEKGLIKIARLSARSRISRLRYRARCERYTVHTFQQFL